MTFTVLIDDKRAFIDKREAEVLRDSPEALSALTLMHAFEIEVDELWLDHDLGYVEGIGFDTIMPVVTWLEEQAYNGEPFRAKKIMVHTMNPGAQQDIVRCLKRRGYNVRPVNLFDEMVLIDEEYL